MLPDLHNDDVLLIPIVTKKDYTNAIARITSRYPGKRFIEVMEYTSTIKNYSDEPLNFYLHASGSYGCTPKKWDWSSRYRLITYNNTRKRLLSAISKFKG